MNNKYTILNNEKNKKLVPSRVNKKQEVQLYNDIVYEILSFHSDFHFLMKTGLLVSKQWFNIIMERIRNFSFTCFSLKKTQQSLPQQLSQNITTLIVNNNSRCNDIDINNLQFICDNMKQLTLLKIDYNRINLESAKYLTRLQKLKHISLYSNLKFDEKALDYINQLKELQYLGVYKNNIRVSGAESISKMIQLTNLNISSNFIGSEGAYYISKLPHLTILNICENNIGSDGAEHISELKQLTNLNIENNRIKDNGAKCIGKLSQLKILNIAKNRITFGAMYLLALKQLTNLDISRNDLQALGSFFVSEMKQLTNLDISLNNIGTQGALNINQMKLVNRYRFD
ncbi:predicted protein [Naegleria gruberi]|uniref:Predicted protein n=1 Tax=Naegleria gruberi TaxID=5762 RepID=D2V0L3_NAEGR|nr:uncharacterized protein NAEGRDRAFT_62334 [Naegleria gruberi]EFC49741.1 predicted protein [Naegleria gruberi]|eukprot:XP_002682485.1 predicted protein [Naegleria gruberi strain NEG-M]